MADTYTTNLNLTKPEPGAAEDTWGISLNADLDSLDAIFSSSGTQINLNPNQINFADNKKAIFGTGSDLEIYHDGSHSYISENGTGNLILKGGGQILLKSPANENMIVATGNGAVGLYYDNVAKLSTTSSGIDVTGNITSTASTGNGTFNLVDTQNVLNAGNKIAFFAANRSNTDEEMAFIQPRLQSNSGGAGNVQEGYLDLGTTGKKRITINPNGDISFYEDTGTTQALFWDTSAEKLGIGTTAPSAALHISGTSADQIRLERTNHDTFRIGLQSAVGLGFHNVTDNRTDMMIKGDGSVGIGTTSPSSALDVTGTVTSDALKIVDSTTSNISLMEDGSSGADIKYIGSNNNFVIATGTGGAGSQTQRLSIQRDTGDISFYEDTGTTQALFWDASTERLGLGTTSPSTTLEVNAPASNGIRISSTTPYLFLNDTDTGAGYDGSISQSGTTTYIGGASAAQTLVFRNKASFGESARLDTSGNLLVSTTDNSPVGNNVAGGIALLSNGSGQFSRDGGTSLLINRKTSDGELLRFNKDGTTVGSIGTVGADVTIGTGDTGLRFRDEFDAIQPHNITTNGTVDGVISLGKTGATFKDLHISGQVNASLGYFSKSGGNNITINSTTANATSLKLQNSVRLYSINTTYDGNLTFYDGTATSERARIDTSGNLLVGTTTSDPNSTAGAQLSSIGRVLGTVDGSNAGYFNRLTSDGEIVRFEKDGTTVGNIKSRSGDLIIHTGITGLRFNDGNDAIHPVIVSGSVSDGATDLGLTNARFKDLHLSGTANVNKVIVGDGTDSGIIAPYNLYLTSGNSNVHIFNKADGSEKARIDSSGNFGIGTTSPVTPLHVSTAKSSVTDSVLTLQDTTETFGRMIEFVGAGSTDSRGIIGFQEPEDNAPELFIANGGGDASGNGVGLAFWNYINVDRIIPCDNLGALQDNVIDLGSSNARFDDIYATNGTIQTSDRNDKQDIEAITDAETRVAVACKGLIRKFRWKSAVAKKDDNSDSDETARIHFGIIAQDLQDAFTAEGLDAGDYAMFTSQTWEDSDGVEQTRLGVRYSELLAFIIAAI